MSVLHDTDLIAGEYVLGTLSLEEREAVEARAAEDMAYAASIVVWERRLGPLNELIAPRKPPAEIWTAIVGRRRDTPQLQRARRDSFADMVHRFSRERGPVVAAELLAVVRRWLYTAFAGVAATAILLVYIGFSLVGGPVIASLTGPKAAHAIEQPIEQPLKSGQ